MAFTQEVMQALFDVRDAFDRLRELEDEKNDVMISFELREFEPAFDGNNGATASLWQFFKQLVAVDYDCRSNSFVLLQRPVKIESSEYEALLEGCLAHLYYTKSRTELGELVDELLDEINAEHYLPGEEEEKEQEQK